jgi:hypothetical protein
MEDDKKVPETPEIDPKTLYTREHPHPTGAYWDPDDQRWHGYKARKGFHPPWNPFDNKYRKPRGVSVNERKFVYIYSQTGNMSEAFRAVYKIKPYPDKRLESARVRSMAHRVLERVRRKDPKLVAELLFEDVTPDFVKKEMYKLYNSDHSTIAEKTRLLENMGKMHAMFTDKVVTDQKIREITDPVYTEAEEDFPDTKDLRYGRVEIEEERVDVV